MPFSVFPANTDFNSRPGFHQNLPRNRVSCAFSGHGLPSLAASAPIPAERTPRDPAEPHPLKWVMMKVGSTREQEARTEKYVVRFDERAPHPDLTFTSTDRAEVHQRQTQGPLRGPLLQHIPPEVERLDVVKVIQMIDFGRVSKVQDLVRGNRHAIHQMGH